MKKLLLVFVLCVAHHALANTFNNATSTTASQPPSTKESSITKVTVYLSGAQIERSATLTIHEGTNTFLFDNLSNDIDENSIQISGLGDSSILSINFGINYLTEQLNSAQVDSLKSVKKQLETSILKLNSTLSGLEKEEEVIASNQRLGSTTTEIDLAKIKELATYYRTRITEIKNAKLDAEIEKTALQRQIQDITKQFNELNVTEEKSKGQITLKINSERTEALKLRITYNLSEAGWYPEYDLKAVATDAPLELSYKAHLYQKTGINWDDVHLTLSTGDPNTNNLKPTLETKYLNFVNQYYRNNSTPTKAYRYKYNPNVKTITGIVTENNGPLPGANVIVKGTSNGTQTDFDGKYSIEVNKGETLVFSYVGFSTVEIPIHASTINASLEADNALDEVVVIGYGTKRGKKARGYAVSSVSSESLDTHYEGDVAQILQGRAAGVDITDGRNIRIRGSNSLKGGRRYRTTATGDTKTEGLTNTTFDIQKKYSIDSDGDVTVIEIDKFQVPATYEYYVAPAINENVFLTASIKDWVRYSLLPGEANIYFEGSFSGKTFINPLETTEELSVSLGVDPSIVVKRKQLDNFKSKSFIGTQRIIDMAYATTVKNNKTKAIDLKMVDRIPLSQNKEIKVDDLETGDATYDKDTGLLEWDIKLAPTASAIKEFSYELKYPKYKRINL